MQIQRAKGPKGQGTKGPRDQRAKGPKGQGTKGPRAQRSSFVRRRPSSVVTMSRVCPHAFLVGSSGQGAVHTPQKSLASTWQASGKHVTSTMQAVSGKPVFVASWYFVPHQMRKMTASNCPKYPFYIIKREELMRELMFSGFWFNSGPL